MNNYYITSTQSKRLKPTQNPQFTPPTGESIPCAEKLLNRESPEKDRPPLSVTLPLEDPEDAGLRRLLASSDHALYEVFRAGEGYKLAKTIERLKTKLATERVSKGAAFPNKEELANPLANLKANTKYVVEHLHEFTRYQKKQLVETLYLSKNLEDWLPDNITDENRMQILENALNLIMDSSQNEIEQKLFDHLLKDLSKEQWGRMINDQNKDSFGYWSYHCFKRLLSEGHFAHWNEEAFLEVFGLLANAFSSDGEWNIEKMVQIVKSVEGRLTLIETIANTRSFSARNYKDDIIKNIDHFRIESFSQQQLRKLCGILGPKHAIKILDRFHIESLSFEELEMWATTLNSYSGALFEHLSLPEEWNQILRLAEMFMRQRAAENVFSTIILPEKDPVKQHALLQIVIEKGEGALIVKYLDQMDTRSWPLSQWTEYLEATKNHIRGVELAEKIPKEFRKNPTIVELTQICKESKRALEKVTGHTWFAVERKQDPESKGYFFIYESHPQTDVNSAIGDWEVPSKIRKAIFPAVELPATYLSDTKEHRLSPYKELGFKFLAAPKPMGAVLEKRSTLVLPDLQVIKHRWKALQQEKPELPELSISESAGIASDEDFLNAQFNYQAICSDGVEFLHDMLLHVLPTLSFIYREPEKWAEYKKAWSSFIQKGMKILDAHKEELDEKHYEQFLNLLSFAADGLSAQSEYPANFAKNGLAALPYAYGYESKVMYYEGQSEQSMYLDRQFGKDRISPWTFVEDWAKIFGKYSEEY